MIKISTDGGKTWQDAGQLRVLKPLEGPDGMDAEIAFNFTEEGVVNDVWVMDVCEGTSSETYREIGDRIVQ